MSLADSLEWLTTSTLTDLMPVPSGVQLVMPVALTLHVKKTFQRLVLQHVGPQVCDCLDSLQFAYQADTGVDNSFIYLLHRAYTHQGKAHRTEGHVL